MTDRSWSDGPPAPHSKMGFCARRISLKGNMKGDWRILKGFHFPDEEGGLSDSRSRAHMPTSHTHPWTHTHARTHARTHTQIYRHSGTHSHVFDIQVSLSLQLCYYFSVEPLELRMRRRIGEGRKRGEEERRGREERKRGVEGRRGEKRERRTKDQKCTD